MATKALVVSFLGLAALSFAQLKSDALTTGYVLDTRSGTLRPVLGMPGASQLGGAVPFAAGIVEAAVRNHRAVVVSNEERSHVYVLQDVTAVEPQVTLLETAIAPVSQVFLNATGTAALLYSSESQLFQFVTSLESTPVTADPIPVSSLNGTFSAAAFAQSKNCALIATSNGTDGFVQQVCADNGQVAVIAQLPAAKISAIAYARHDQDALLTDSAGEHLLLLPDFAQGSAPVILAGPDEGIHSPVAVVAVNDSTIVVTGSQSPGLVLIDRLQKAAPRIVILPDLATRLEFLDAPGVLACTRVGAGPLLLMDTLQDYTSFYVPMN